MNNGGYIRLNHSDEEEFKLTQQQQNGGLTPVLSMPGDGLSLRRKLCLLASLIMCLFYLVTFVGFLPCLPATTRQPASRFSQIWSSPLPVRATGLHPASGLVLLLDSDQGLSAVSASSGQSLWNSSLVSRVAGGCLHPSLCLAAGSHDNLALFNTSSGSILWSSQGPPKLRDHGPVALEDCDLDGIQEFSILKDKSIELITGVSGKVFNTVPLPSSQCGDAKLHFWSSPTQSWLLLHCTRLNSSVVWSLSLLDICSNSTPAPTLSLKQFARLNEVLDPVEVYGKGNRLYLVGTNRVLALDAAGRLLWTLDIPQDSKIWKVEVGAFDTHSSVLAILYTTSNSTHLTILHPQDGSVVHFWKLDGATTFETKGHDLNLFLVKFQVPQVVYKVVTRQEEMEVFSDLPCVTCPHSNKNTAAIVSQDQCDDVYILAENRTQLACFRSCSSVAAQS